MIAIALTEMWRTKLLMSVVCFSASIPAWSAGLPEIYELARERAPEMRAATAAFEANDAVRNQSLLALLPSLTASGEAAKDNQNVLETGVGNTGRFRFNSSTYSLTLRQ